MARISKSKSRRGAELIEFTLALLPLLAMTFLLLDVAWAIFAQSTLAYAVRAGLRFGVTETGTQLTLAGGTDLTTMVKQRVQSSAIGFLGKLPTDPGYQAIKVHYYRDSDVQDVCSDPNGYKPGYIMTVSIEGYAMNSLVARIWGWHESPDASRIAVGAIAADLVEPSRDLPTRGLAP
jgi:TadE-like protein